MRLTVWFLVILSGLAAVPSLMCQEPDREPRPEEWGYRPAEGEAVSLNPPPLSWVRERDASHYRLQLADNPDFETPLEVSPVRWSVYTHHQVLKPGPWWWRYRLVFADGRESSWSRTRDFKIPQDAEPFPQPTMEELKRRIPKGHPRLFVRPEDLPSLRKWASTGGRESYQNLIRRADALLGHDPTPEPTVRATPSDPVTRKYWWSNRVQAIQALQEAEILTFTWLLTQESKYADPARRFTLKLAEWDPDGPSNFALNCEVAKPLVHRLARAYDWAWPLFTTEERQKIRAALLRRALDAWKSGEIGRGAGHLSRPYSSHGNRMWHKLAENAIATLGETPEAEDFLQYAMTKFFGAYPVWSDDDGGWHEGLSYLSSYMSKTPWWIDIAQAAIRIDSFKKPFFSRIGDYPLYSAPPGTPDLGFGDSSVGPVSARWSFLHYYVRRTGNQNWAWWLNQWQVPERINEPVLDFLRSRMPVVSPDPLKGLPPSKLFRGIGVAIMNTNLLNGRENVQVRFKSSPLGRRSHGQDPHNTFTLNAYGTALLVNNVYRDLWGSPFQTRWVWSSKAQNAVLVNGSGQEPRSASPEGRILKAEFMEGLDYVAGEAAAAYKGKMKRARRHVIFVKPEFVMIADELEAVEASTFQWMLHGWGEFALDEAGQKIVLDRGNAGVVVDYVAPEPLKLRQWSGYEPEPDAAYFQSVGRNPIPQQWHVEAASSDPRERLFAVTVIRVFRDGKIPPTPVQSSWINDSLEIATGPLKVSFGTGKAQVRKADRTWQITYPE